MGVRYNSIALGAYYGKVRVSVNGVGMKWEVNMQNVTLAEIEMLASLLMRAGVTPIEASFANSVLDRLRAAAAAVELQQKQTRENNDDPEAQTG